MDLLKLSKSEGDSQVCENYWLTMTLQFECVMCMLFEWPLVTMTATTAFHYVILLPIVNVTA